MNQVKTIHRKMLLLYVWACLLYTSGHANGPTDNARNWMAGVAGIVHYTFSNSIVGGCRKKNEN